MQTESTVHTTSRQRAFKSTKSVFLIHTQAVLVLYSCNLVGLNVLYTNIDQFLNKHDDLELAIAGNEGYPVEYIHQWKLWTSL